VHQKLENYLIWKKKDDVRKYVIRRTITKDGKKPVTKAPKIQRLVTPQRLQRKRHHIAIKRYRYESTRKSASEFNDLLAARAKEQREARYTKAAKRRSESRKESTKVTPAATATTKSPVVAAAKAPAKAVTAAKPAATATAAKPVAAAKPAAKAAPATVTKPVAAAKPVTATATKSPVVTATKTDKPQPKKNK